MALTLVALFTLFPTRQTETGAETAIGLGSLENLRLAYSRWTESYEAKGPRELSIGLVWNKGLSVLHSSGRGLASIDLERGTVRVRVKGLESDRISDVWLVSNRPGPGRSTLPEDEDRLIKAGVLTFRGEYAFLDARIAPERLRDTIINWLVVARRDEAPGAGGVLYGSTSLFQKMYHYPKQMDLAGGSKSAPGLLRTVLAQGVTPPGFPDAQLINEGREPSAGGRRTGRCTAGSQLREPALR